MEAFVFLRTAENGRELRSRLEGILNVPQKVRLRRLLCLPPRWTTVLSGPNRREVNT